MMKISRKTAHQLITLPPDLKKECSPYNSLQIESDLLQEIHGTLYWLFDNCQYICKCIFDLFCVMNQTSLEESDFLFSVSLVVSMRSFRYDQSILGFCFAFLYT